MKNILIIIPVLFIAACSINRQGTDNDKPEEITYITSNENGSGPWITLEFKKGDSFYYPLVVVWLEEMEGNYIQSLFVPQSVATSVFRFGEVHGREWEPGVRRWPQTVPYWAHKRNIKASDGLYMPDPESPVPDAYSGATPVTGFVLSARSDNPVNAPVRVMLEVNQNWDWNEYWTNDRFPGDEYYLRSCQPAVVYEAILDPAFPDRVVAMKPIGHSHHSGATGELFPDLSTLTTALHIADSITVRFGK
ncbi:MAG: hypothetical protein R2744_01280 [Bacteroidales bacterium]